MERPTESELRWVYRVAVALTADEGAGRRLVVGVVRDVPEIGKASEARLLRTLMDRAGDRSVRGALLAVRGVGDAGHAVIEAAGEGGVADRDVLLLRRGAGVEAAVLGLAFGESAKAMGERVARVETGVRERVGERVFEDGVRDIEGAFAGMRLRGHDDAVASAWDAARRGRRRAAIVSLAALGVFLFLMGYVVADLLGWDERQAALEVLSNPMPVERAPENLAPSNR